MNKDDSEIVVTDIFKANDMVAESDLFLQFKLREILDRCNDVSAADKAGILRYEAERVERKPQP